jgi:hypothetical protein
MSQVCEEKSKMQKAAMKAWETIRLKKLTSGQVAEVETSEKKEKKVKETVEKEVFEKPTVWDKKELAYLNGDELKKLARDNGKRAMKNIQKQMRESRAIEVGGIIKEAIQNVNGFKAETKA